VRPWTKSMQQHLLTSSSVGVESVQQYQLRHKAVCCAAQEAGTPSILAGKTMS